jgi:5-epi-alpha-selinene synthase
MREQIYVSEQMPQGLIANYPNPYRGRCLSNRMISCLHYLADMKNGQQSAAMESIVLPKLSCPFTRTINEHIETTHRGSVEWVWRFRLCPNEQTLRLFEAIGIGRLAARTHPDCSRDKLQLVSDWYAWLFILDDIRDASEFNGDPEKLSVMDNRFFDILEGKVPNNRDTPLVFALHDLRERLCESLGARGLSDVWMRRFIRTIKESFEASLWEAANRARGTTPGIESYVRMRPLTGGLSIITRLTEIIEGNHLPHEVREHPTVRHLTDASDNIVCWANDILSLHKELKTGEVNNLVVVLRNAEALTLQQAIDRAAKMYETEVRTFVELEEHLPSFGTALDTALGRYVSFLRTRIQGVLDWSYESARYWATFESERAATSSSAVWASTGSENQNP